VTSGELAQIVQRAAESADRGETYEDDRVELKSQWPEPFDMAQQIAAQANARSAQEFVWLIGIREKKGVVGTEHRDSAGWLPVLRKYFDEGILPKLARHENFDINSKTVVALVWDPSEPPYLINRNREGRKARPEVLWREANSIRAADRQDLLHILEPIAFTPALEFVPGPGLQHIGAKLFEGGNRLQWSLRCWVRVKPLSSRPVVIPYGGTTCRLVPDNTEEPIPVTVFMYTNEGETPFRTTGSGEVTFSAPASIGLIGPTLQNPLPLIDRPKRIKSEIMFQAVGARGPAKLTVDWKEPNPTPAGWWGYWVPEVDEGVARS
jgi:hypothetical protein